jgi:hypothetical protein
MAYTPTNWLEGVTTLGPTNMNKIETELAYLDARIAPAALSYGTTLPGSPVDGQEAILVDSTTVPGYHWRFRYNAGDTTANKWEYLGGRPAQFAPTDSTGVISTTPLATSGSFTIPRAGPYMVTYYAFIQSTGTWTTPFDANLQPYTTGLLGQPAKVIVTGQYVGASVTSTIFTSLNASDVVTLRVWVTNATSTDFRYMGCMVTPLRVS